MSRAIDAATVEHLASAVQDTIANQGLGVLGSPKRFNSLLADYYGNTNSREMEVFSQALVKNEDSVLLADFATVSGSVSREDLVGIAERATRRLVVMKVADADDARACMMAIALGVGRSMGANMGSAESLLSPAPKQEPKTKTSGSGKKPPTSKPTASKPPASGHGGAHTPPKPKTPPAAQPATPVQPPSGGHVKTGAPTKPTTVPPATPQQQGTKPEEKESKSNLIIGIVAILVVIFILVPGLETCDSGSSDASGGWRPSSTSSAAPPRSSSSSAVAPRSSSSSAVTPPSTTRPKGVHELLPRSDVDRYVYSDVHTFSDFELFVARNEMYARKGYKFETPFTRDYFAWTRMYTATTSDYDAVDASMSDIERSNINLILGVEKDRESPFLDDAYVKKLSWDNFDTEHILPSSSSVEYAPATLKTYSSFELFIARNEFYAKKGYRFENDFLSKYFEGRSWYTPSTSDYDAVDSLMSVVERDNINKILDIEKSRKSPYLDDKYIAKL